MIALQFGAIVAVVERFALENEAFRSVLWLSFAGFFIHHALPQRFRRQFFLLLSLVSIAWVMGLDASGWNLYSALGRTSLLLFLGAVLVGVCHLPLSYARRVGLLVGIATLLALLRAGKWFDMGGYAAVWPILGAMFMFRIMVYIYDLENMKQKPTWVDSLSYFFLLPNVCFPLFPVIDFKTFCRTYFNRAPNEVYDTGVRWMLRGVIHLILWRLVYYHLFIDPSKVTDGRDLVQFLLSNVALYLRVSGQFHFVIGLLHMFGFNLPETNRFYFLSSSFTDYWRRVNIYWKDFILKIVYNPTVFRLKHLGEERSVIAATVLAFAVTWLLHSYQWFWLRGDFPLAATDMVFWGALGVVVIVNSVRELRHGRQRTLVRREASIGSQLRIGIQTAATFGALTFLWSIWNSESLTHVVQLWKLADLDTLWMSAIVLVGIGGARVALERHEAASAKPAPKRLSALTPVVYDWRGAVCYVLLPCLLLGVLSLGRLQNHVGRDVALVLSSLKSNAPNDSDEEQMRAGYYEDLMDVRRFNSLLSEAYMSQPADWQLLENTGAIKVVNDIRLKELAASTSHIVNGNRIDVNSHGMRDQEYALQKPPHTYRIALLGSSLVMGWGVQPEEIFESLLEQRLNQEAVGGRKIEILNFAVNGYSVDAQAETVRRRVVQFAPDAIVLVGHWEDPFFTSTNLPKAIRKGVALDSQTAAIAAKANVDAETPQMWARHRLEPYWPDLIGSSMRSIVEVGRKANSEMVWVYLPGVLEKVDEARDRKEQMLRMAREAGFTVIDLSGLYPDGDRSNLVVAPWDAHPNALAHRMIADLLYDKLQSSPGIGLFSNLSPPQTE